MHKVLHSLRRDWVYSGFSIATLGIVLGVNLLLFSVVKVVLLDPLPYPQSDRLVLVHQIHERSGFRRQGGFTSTAIRAFREHPVFDSLVAYLSYQGKLETGSAGDSLTVPVSRVSDPFFDTMGLQFLQGRPFEGEEFTAGKDSVAVVRIDLWRSLYGNQGLADQRLRLDGRDYSIVGIAPRHLEFPSGETQVWRPLAMREGGFSYPVVGRLAPGADSQAAQDAVLSILGDDAAVEAVILKESRIAPYRPTLRALLGVAVGLFLMVCFTIASLSMVRFKSRSRSLALREVLGARRFEIVARLGGENVLICASAAVFGWALAALAFPAIAAVLPFRIPRIEHVDIGRDGAAVLLALPFLMAMILTLIAALLMAKTDLREALSQGERTVGPQIRGRKSAAFLLAAEIAVSLALVHSAFLLAASYWSLATVSTGFENANVLSLEVAFPRARPETRVAQIDETLSRLRDIPYLRSAGVGTGLPLAGTRSEGSFHPPGFTPGQGTDAPVVRNSQVDSGYFESLGIRILEGSYPVEATAEPVVLVNQRFEREYYMPGGALHEGLDFGGGEVFRIVGIVEDVRQQELSQSSHGQVYFPLGPGRPTSSPFAIRRAFFVLHPGPEVDHETILRDFRAILSAVEPGTEILDARSMEDRIDEKLGTPFFWNTVIGAMAFIAFVMALAGIFGVSARITRSRFSEFGIRLALGALPADLTRLVVRSLATPVLLGIGSGLLLAYFSSRMVTGLLFGLAPTNPLILISAIILYLAASLLGTWLPASRGSKADPLEALRST